ncbi:uncharacterized protein Bfra_004605 [Botrytis fragariae]|uniref:Uncharacterized protein n=1 Tax=Botrytis fragariae TaxID=1964551 RepID=A0A8H6AW41_9HELO|nr:uncharacterized protein Bfra_004605 [Botrytis fragariae]KAF5874594.1 hypothetical protein Bfra_004605 [Botrytis fragariae]
MDVPRTDNSDVFMILMRIGFASLLWMKSPALFDIETLERLRKVRNVRGKKVGGFETRKTHAQPSVSSILA